MSAALSTPLTRVQSLVFRVLPLPRLRLALPLVRRFWCSLCTGVRKGRNVYSQRSQSGSSVFLPETLNLLFDRFADAKLGNFLSISFDPQD